MLNAKQLADAIAFNAARGLPISVSPRTFARIVYAAQSDRGLLTDGKFGGESAREFIHQDPNPDSADLAKVFADWVHPLPGWKRADGVVVKPYMSSGFVDNNGVGPNQDRYRHTGRGHLGNDYDYRWDRKGQRPSVLFDRVFYCPPVPVYAMGPGVVEYAKLLDVSDYWGGDRWAVLIYHGKLEGFGYCSTWSVHHKEVHVEAGDVVTAGTIVATAGDTGCKGAPHVHQELWRWQEADEGGTKSGHDFAIDTWPIVQGLEVRMIEVPPL